MSDFLLQNETIYTDFDFVENLPEIHSVEQKIEPSHKMSGNTVVDHWKSQLMLYAAQNSIKYDIRPKAQDKISKEWLLIDSGAQISIWPKSKFPSAEYDPNMSIQAVNKSKIVTYGKRDITVRFGRKHYHHTVIIADIAQPILGWDICRKYLLSLVWTEDGDLELWDRKANIFVPLQMSAEKESSITGGCTVTEETDQISHLKEVFAVEIENFKSFQEYAANQKQESAKNESNDIEKVPEKYKTLLKSILKY